MIDREHKCPVCGHALEDRDCVGKKTVDGVEYDYYQCLYCDTRSFFSEDVIKAPAKGETPVSTDNVPKPVAPVAPTAPITAPPTSPVVGNNKPDSAAAYGKNHAMVLNVFFYTPMGNMRNLGYGVLIGGGYMLSSLSLLRDVDRTRQFSVSNAQYDKDDFKMVYCDEATNLALFYSPSIDKGASVTFSEVPVRMGNKLYVISSVKMGNYTRHGMFEVSVGRVDMGSESIFTIDRIDGAKYLGGLVVNDYQYAVGIVSDSKSGTYGINYIVPTSDIESFIAKANQSNGFGITLSVAK